MKPQPWPSRSLCVPSNEELPQPFEFSFDEYFRFTTLTICSVISKACPCFLVVIDPQRILQNAGAPGRADSGNGHRLHRHRKPTSALSSDILRHCLDLVAQTFALAEPDQADASRCLAHVS